MSTHRHTRGISTLVQIRTEYLSLKTSNSTTEPKSPKWCSTDVEETEYIYTTNLIMHAIPCIMRDNST
jgi:hypothetical protein